MIGNFLDFFKKFIELGSSIIVELLGNEEAIGFFVIFDFEFGLFGAIEFLPGSEHLFYFFSRSVSEGTHQIDVASLNGHILIFVFVEFVEEHLLIFVQFINLFPLESELIYQL